MSDEQTLPATAAGIAPGASRLTGRRILVLGGGSQGEGNNEASYITGQTFVVDGWLSMTAT